MAEMITECALMWGPAENGVAASLRQEVSWGAQNPHN